MRSYPHVILDRDSAARLALFADRHILAVKSMIRRDHDYMRRDEHIITDDQTAVTVENGGGSDEAAVTDRD